MSDHDLHDPETWGKWALSAGAVLTQVKRLRVMLTPKKKGKPKTLNLKELQCEVEELQEDVEKLFRWVFDRFDADWELIIKNMQSHAELARLAPDSK